MSSLYETHPQDADYVGVEEAAGLQPMRSVTRTFIALELDTVLQSHVRGILRQMALAFPRLRWVDPTDIHLTLAFLGELTDTQLALAKEAARISAQSVAPFDYRLTSLGTFGSPRFPRVIWIGINEPSGRLLQLHHTLNRELEQRGFTVDQRPFSPHLTLARIKHPLPPDELQRLQQILASKHYLSPSHRSAVQFVSVMKSELSRSGAVYTCLQQCPLGSA